jgi:hypothetical protein
MKIQHNQHAKGYMPWGEQTLDYSVQTKGDTKETWAVMGELERNSYMDQKSALLVCMLHLLLQPCVGIDAYKIQQYSVAAGHVLTGTFIKNAKLW